MPSPSPLNAPDGSLAGAAPVDSMLFESSPDCVKLMDLDGRIVAMNRNGRCAMEIDDFCLIAGTLWSALWPHESRALVEASVSAAAAGETGHFAAFCPTARGTPRWWEVVITPITNEHDQVSRLMSVSRDVTNIHIANEQLRASREHFAVLLDSSSDGLYGIDADGACTFINRTGAALLGYRADQLKGRVLHGLVHGRDAHGAALALAACPIMQAVSGRASVRCDDATFYTSDGAPIPVSYAVAPLLADGGVGGAVVTFNDTSERRRAELALHESRERLHKIITQAATGVVETSIDGTITLVNAKFCSMLGYTEAQLLGTSVNSLTAPRFQSTTGQAIGQLVIDGQPFVIEKQYMRRDGSLLWATSSVNALRRPDGTIEALVAVVIDITERMEAEAKLRDADQRKDEFLAMLAHELRNPLAPIGAAAQLIRSSRLSEQAVRNTSDVIVRQVAHMTSLVDDLLDVSRVTRGQVELERQPIDIMEVIADAVEQIAPLIDARGHTLDVVPCGEPAIVHGDKKRLVQVVANLLNNAAKYTGEGGRITLRTDLHADSVGISVTDNGIGMEAELSCRVFDLFTQARRTPDRASGGLGLGLALVRSLVELHGGSVSCASEGEARGSQFSLSLPRIAPLKDAATRIVPLPPLPEPSSRALRVMIVDDNHDAADMLAMLLEASGHNVIIEYGARKALMAARDDVADVFLLDIGLPDMDGMELASALRAGGPSAGKTMIAISGYGQESDRDRALAAGFDHYLVKPVQYAALSAILSTCPDRPVA